MLKKIMGLCLVLFIFYFDTADCEIISEKHITQLSGSFVPYSLTKSPDSKSVAFVNQVGKKQCVIVDGKEGKQYDLILEITYTKARVNPTTSVIIKTQVGDHIKFSPDSQRIAYKAKVGMKWCVVIDRKEEKEYDGILAGTLTFSPDSKRVAYVAFQASFIFNERVKSPFDF